ncbi:MAG TPA: endopeptidase La [Gemmatimonadaceae bacterium]|nr:endopeptidase La [Gemmatimonadaceae bacterium]
MPTLLRDADQFVVGERLPTLPLRDVVVFPYVVMPLLVGRAGSLAAIEGAAGEDRCVLLVTQRSGDTEEPSAADMYRVGVVGRILQLSHAPNGTVKVLIEGLARVRVARYVPTAGHLRAQVVPIPELGSPEDAAQVEALARRVVEQFEEYVSLHRRIPSEVVALVQAADSAARQAYAIAAHLAVRVEVRQGLLDTGSLRELLQRLGDVLGAEIDLLRLERKIDEDVRGSLFQNQREFYLQEQLKAIHRELGGADDGDDVDGLQAQIEAKRLPEAVHARATRELRKLRRIPPLSPESTVARNFLDWILALPWTERSDDVLDVAHARRVLDEDHHGLEEVKDRILDYIGVLSLVGHLEGPILCLVGPPGVGKTSLGRSIARALGRRFVRMSLGGVRDEAEIRGHRRTYIGSMPGRVLQAMRRAEVTNPVILLDEVDKLGQDYRGDPSAALLEVLDPEQNRAFNDHYLEVDYDLSQVLFLTTANYLPKIPEPLRDRMEIIRLSGYLDQEKYAIARHFLVPKQLRAHGLDPAAVGLDPDVIPAIVHGYTREAGVRELERRIARVSRKLARRAAESAVVARESALGSRAPGIEAAGSALASPSPLQSTSADFRGEPADHVSVSDLPALLGTAPYDPSELTLESKVGVATGLAYTSAGGEVLEIEVSVVNGRGKLQLTGTLGDVMKESASAALSYARARAELLQIDRDFHRTRDLHVHIPAGATPKDGPSAGIAIATAIVSALTGSPVRGDVAMTGEITLRGRVLPIGGLKEKAVAAHRNRLAHVIIPQQNARDLEELPDEVRTSVSFHPVKTMDDVLRIALEPRAEARARAEAGTPAGGRPIDRPTPGFVTH